MDDELRAELDRISHRLSELEKTAGSTPGPTGQADGTRLVSRAGLLRSAAVGLAAVGGAQVLGPVRSGNSRIAGGSSGQSHDTTGSFTDQVEAGNVWVGSVGSDSTGIYVSPGSEPTDPEYDPGIDSYGFSTGVRGTSVTGSGIVGASGHSGVGGDFTGGSGIVCTSSADDGWAVRATHNAEGWAVMGYAPSGSGVLAVGGADFVAPQTSVGLQAWGVTTGVYSYGGQQGVYGSTDNEADDAAAIFGEMTAAKPGIDSSGVRGQHDGTGSDGTGVYGSHAGSGTGGYFTSFGGTGVLASATNGTGVSGSGSVAGVTGDSQAGPGVAGTSISGAGLSGSSTSGSGVTGSSSSHTGVAGESESGFGLSGLSTTGTGVVATSPGGRGGGLAQISLIPASTVGKPRTGAHVVGDLFLDRDANLYLCTRAGTPGHWVKVNVTHL